MKRLIFGLVLFVFTLLVCTSNVEAQISFDSLVFKLQAYGMLSYTIPIDISYDALLDDYADTAYIWVVVDSLPIPDSVAVQFDFVHVTQNMWVSHTIFTDSGRIVTQGLINYDTLTGCIIDTTINTSHVAFRQYTAILIHIVPEGAPAWIKDLRGN